MHFDAIQALFSTETRTPRVKRKKQNEKLDEDGSFSMSNLARY